MTKEQALAMLKFIADLYQIIQVTSDPEPTTIPEPVRNGSAHRSPDAATL